MLVNLFPRPTVPEPELMYKSKRSGKNRFRKWKTIKQRARNKRARRARRVNRRRNQ